MECLMDDYTLTYYIPIPIVSDFLAQSMSTPCSLLAPLLGGVAGPDLDALVGSVVNIPIQNSSKNKIPISIYQRYNNVLTASSSGG